MKNIFVAGTIIISAMAFASIQNAKPRTHNNSYIYYSYVDSVPRKKKDTLPNPDTSKPKPDTMMHR